VISADITKRASKVVLSIHVLKAFIGGKIVYQANPARNGK